MPRFGPSFWMQNEGIWLWRVFFLALMAGGIAELVWPWRQLVKPLLKRWSSHAALFAAGNAAAVFLFPTGSVALAIAVTNSPYGILNRPVVPFALRFLVCVLLLDAGKYAIHYVLHSQSLLWRIHVVHHSDPDFDIFTGLRFHPLEFVMVHGIGLATVAIAAPPVVAVVAFELAAMMQSLLAHMNVSFSPAVDRILRYAVITPNMHRVHHSDREADQKTNLGVLFPWWDRMFGTYRDSHSPGEEYRRVGLMDFPDRRILNVFYLLALPFVRVQRAPITEDSPTETREPILGQR